MDSSGATGDNDQRKGQLVLEGGFQNQGTLFDKDSHKQDAPIFAETATKYLFQPSSQR